MCLGIPGQIVELDGVDRHRAVIDVEGVRREVNVGLVVDDAEPIALGDWVLVHVGFAMAKIDADEAARTLELVRDLDDFFQDGALDVETAGGEGLP